MLARILGCTFLGLALCTFSIEAGGGKDKKLTDVTGTVASVDKKGSSFIISVNNKERKFIVTADTKFLGPKGGKRGTGKTGLNDDCMAKGYEIRVVPAKDPKNAAEVHLPNRKTDAKKDKK
jgi:hypothetical protein